MKYNVIVSIIAFFLLSASAIPKCLAVDCNKYFGHGYCTDYIQYRIGFRQSKDAGKWQGNISASQVRVGDVAIFASTENNSYGLLPWLKKLR